MVDCVEGEGDGRVVVGCVAVLWHLSAKYRSGRGTAMMVLALRTTCNASLLRLHVVEMYLFGGSDDGLVIWLIRLATRGMHLEAIMASPRSMLNRIYGSKD